MNVNRICSFFIYRTIVSIYSTEQWHGYIKKLPFLQPSETPPCKKELKKKTLIMFTLIYMLCLYTTK